jgi:hypothetical protein
MRKHLQLKWMLTASTLLTTSFTLPGVARAAAGDDISRGIASTGRAGPRDLRERRCSREGASDGSWGDAGFDSRLLEEQLEEQRESRSKPVPSANTESGKAPRSAAAEVSQFYRRDSVQSANAKILQANSHGHQATPQEIDQSGVPQVAETQAAETDPGMTYGGTMHLYYGITEGLISRNRA